MILVATGQRHLARAEFNGFKADGAVLGRVTEGLALIGERLALHHFPTERALGLFALIDEPLRDTGHMILMAAGENHTASFEGDGVGAESAIVGHL